MKAQSVYDSLNTYMVESGDQYSIDLWAASSNSTLLGMIPVLDLYRIDSSYIWQNAVLTLTSDGKGVILKGTGVFSELGQESPAGIYAISGALYFTEDSNIFEISLDFDKTWSFADFFSNLPETFMIDPDIGESNQWNPSVLNYFSIDALTLSGSSEPNTELQVKGQLLLPSRSFISDKIPMVSPWPLSLSGWMNLPTSSRDFPIMKLDAIGNTNVITGDAQSGIDGPVAVSIEDPGITLESDVMTSTVDQRISYSTMTLFGDYSFDQIKGRISTFILAVDTIWTFTLAFDKDTSSMVQGLAQLFRFFRVEIPIPMNFPVLSDFYIAEINIDLKNETPNSPSPSFSLQNVSMTIKSDKIWQPPIPFVSFSNLGTRWVWGWTLTSDEDNPEPKKEYLLTGSVFGTINFGDGESEDDDTKPDAPQTTPSRGVDFTKDDVSLDITMGIPSFIIEGEMTEDSVIPITTALNYFFGNEGPPTGEDQMNITGLSFSADPIGQNFEADATIFFGDVYNPDELGKGWDIDLSVLTITLHELYFFVNVNAGKVGGGITGTLFLKQGDDRHALIGNPKDLPRIDIGAEYPIQDPEDSEGWILTGSLYQGTKISLTDLVYQFIYGDSGDRPDNLPSLDVDRLEVEFTTGNDKPNSSSYTFGGTISAQWQPDIFDTKLTISASASLDMEKKSGEETASGKLMGAFSVNKIALEVSMQFGVPEPTYSLKVQFDNLWLLATTAWRGKQDSRHQVVTLQLGGVTLGDVLEYLVNLAEPTLGFTLDSPWDILKKIDLSRFTLTIDPTDNVVEFVFKTDVDLVVAKLDSVGVRYTKSGPKGKVELMLTGDFLGEKYGEDDPLAWDVVNDPPPSVPGAGKSLVDLSYLGIGQHVTTKEELPASVRESVAMLKKIMDAPDEDSPNPLPQGIVYSSESNWLIGLDVKIMDTLQLGFIFNDPVLYGLSIGLSGERAGALAGLKFEILYKKITDDIGMYRIELQVPDMYRTLQFGAVSVTLGIIVVEIYTNGNFKVDLGFPYNRNFDRSFSLQAGIFIGRGGFYLGVLNGDTSTQVPKITNGNFSPVIELGIGIAAGIGREVRYGILSGGAYIQLEVIFEGVLAWFNPTSNGVAPAKFFKAKGIAALHGKIYGSVDFKVIKVSVTLEAYAMVSLTYESYQPMYIEMLVKVSARASIKVLFVRIHFSFSVQVSFSFTVGSAKPTPWILAAGGSGGNNNPGARLRGAAPAPSRSGSGSAYAAGNKSRRSQALRNAFVASKNEKFVAAARMLRSEASCAIEPSGDYLLRWDPCNSVFEDGPLHAHMTLLPLFTIGDMPIDWGSDIPDNPSPQYRSAFVLFADTGMDPEGKKPKDLSSRSAAHSPTTLTDEDTSSLAADILVKGLSLYAANSITNDGGEDAVLTAGQLAILLEQLELPETENTGFSTTALQKFFQTNINLWISGDPGGDINDQSAMVVPMPPYLSWTSPQAGSMDFSSYNEIGAIYEAGIAHYLNQYFSMGEGDQAAPKNDVSEALESFASFMFRDFCLMLTQSAVQEMQKHMESSWVDVAKDGVARTLEGIAGGLPQVTVPYVIHSGDTLGSVAENLGATVPELEFLNPSLEHTLETENVGKKIDIVIGVAPEVLAIDNPEIDFNVDQVTLGDLIHPATTNDTLLTIGNLFEVDVTTMLEFESAALPILRSNAFILQSGATFDLDQQTFTNAPTDYDQARTAGVFYTRYNDLTKLSGSTLHMMANWYAQAIAENNKDKLDAIMPPIDINDNVELVPNEPLNVPIAYNQVTQLKEYTTTNGDTLTRIGYALALSQDFATTNPESLPNWQKFLAGVTSTGANSWSIPAHADVPVVHAENVELLVRRLIVDANWVSGASESPIIGAWTYNWNNVSAWIGDKKILQALAPVTVPGAKTGIHSPLNFTVITEVYGLPIADAATRLKSTLLYSPEVKLEVKMLPAQEVGVLLGEIMKGDSFASIVNQSSRMFMSGLQLPEPIKKDGKVIPDPDNPKPLYDLTGQQFNVAVNGEEPSEEALALEVSSEEPEWITLMDSITVSDTDTLPGLLEEYPDLETYNPGLTEANFKPGMILLTQEDTVLNYNYSNGQIIADGPATGIGVAPKAGDPPAPMPLELSAEVLKNYGLQHNVVLQSPIKLPIPGGTENVSGNPTLWKLPSDLIAKAIVGSSVAYEILGTKEGDQVNKKTKSIENSTYGMLLPFKVKRLENDSNESFALIGVDTEDRNQLIALIDWLDNASNAANTQAFTLLAPAPNANNTDGLTVMTTSPDDTYLIQSNLSTESVPPETFDSLARVAMVEKEEESPSYYATMAQLRDFAMLLWQGSVVGGTGYYFGLDQEIPGSAFDEQGNITLNLLVIAGTQQEVAANGRALLPFNNCVLMGASVDSSLKSMYLESYDHTIPEELMTQSIVPPGNVGFKYITPNPDFNGDPNDPNVQALNLYSLMSYAVAEMAGSNFAASPSGMPVVPSPSDGTNKTSAEKVKDLRNNGDAEIDEESEFRKYEQLLPVKNFVNKSVENPAVDVDGLPTSNSNPYYGFGSSEDLQTANFVFGFGDVLGNRTGNNPDGEGETTINVGYTDNLIGLSEWPSLAKKYSVIKRGNSGIMTVNLSYRSAETLPTPSQSGGVFEEALQQQLDQYATIYYQMVQPRLKGYIVTSLKLVEDPNYANGGTEVSDFSQLWKFAAGAYANTESISKLTSAKPVAVEKEEFNVGLMESKYGIRPVETGLANQDTSVEALFGDNPPIVPAYSAYVENRSMEWLFSKIPNGWPGTDLETIWSDPENTDLPLKDGTLMTIIQKTLKTALKSNSIYTPSLNEIAGSVFTDPTALAVLNENQPVLENGFVFSVEIDEDVYVDITVDDSTNTFVNVKQAFAEQSVHLSVEDLALYALDDEGLFAPDKNLDYDNYVIQKLDTLESNKGGYASSELMDNNHKTENVYDPGTMIYFGKIGDPEYDASVPTLKEFADRYACPVELLIQANADRELPQNSAFVLAGTLDFPEDSARLRVPYTLQIDDTINGVASLFLPVKTAENTSSDLLTANADMPGVLVPNNELEIIVGGSPFTVTTASSNASFQELLDSLQVQAPSATMDDIVNSLGNDTGVLLVGGLFMCPPAKFTDKFNSIEIQSKYGVEAGAFALGNVAMAGIIAVGVTLKAKDPLITIETKENDTFNSLITRFAEKGVSIDANEIVELNPEAKLYMKGGLALLPPAEIHFESDLGTGGPYAAPIIPLDVFVRFTRPQNLIYPDFKKSEPKGPVEMIESTIPAPSRDSNPASGLNFNDFIEAMKLALPNLRVATGQVEGVAQDLWCVDFDAQGIKEVDLTGPVLYQHKEGGDEKDIRRPRFFALKPLYKNLVTRADVPVKPLEADGILGDPVLNSYQNIDAEVWARRFVQDLDQFLTGPYAVSLYNSGMQSQLDKIIGYKNDLIPEIAAGLDIILKLQNKDKAVPLSNAIKALEQQLGVSLGRTYLTTTIVQYESVVDSAWQSSNLPPAALYGSGAIDTQDGDSQAREDGPQDEPKKDSGISIVSAKTHLNKANDYVNFLMTLEQPEFHRSIIGPFTYDISHIEFNIREAFANEEYKASDWLTFIPLQNADEKPAALSGTNPGQVEVPIPLRLFPESPLIQQQLADPQVSDREARKSGSLENLAEWKYGVKYTHQYASQDFVVLTAEFNLRLDQSAMDGEEKRDLFTELAKYIAVADPLWNNLKALGDPEVKVDPKDLENSVNSYVELVEGVSQYWSVRLANDEIEKTKDPYYTEASNKYKFNTRITYNGEQFEKFALIPVDEENPLSGRYGPNGVVPNMYLKDENGDYVQLVLKEKSNVEAIYVLPDTFGTPPSTWPDLKIEWDALNMAKTQNARIKMHVERNKSLLDNLVTNDAFIFATDTITAPSIVTPLNSYGNRFNLNEQGPTLAEALNNAFTTLFAEDKEGQKITMELSYGYELVHGDKNAKEGLVTYLPIGLYPNQKITDQTGQQLSEVIASWEADNKPNPDGGEWVFSLKLYSQMTTSQQTILVIDHMVYFIEI